MDVKITFSFLALLFVFVCYAIYQIKTNGKKSLTMLSKQIDSLELTTSNIENIDYAGEWFSIDSYDFKNNVGNVFLGFMSSDCGWVADSAFWFEGDKQYDEGFYLSVPLDSKMIPMKCHYTHWTPMIRGPKSLENHDGL